MLIIVISSLHSCRPAHPPFRPSHFQYGVTSVRKIRSACGTVFFYHHFHKKFPADSIVVIVFVNVELEQSNRPINQLVVIYGAKQPQQIALPVCLSIRT